MDTKNPFPGREILGLGGPCGHPGGLASYTYKRCILKHAVSTAPASTFTFTLLRVGLLTREAVCMLNGSLGICADVDGCDVDY